MLRINQIKLPVEHNRAALEKKIIRFLGIKPEELRSWSIRKRSLDARKKPELFYVYTVDVSCEKEQQIIRRLKQKVQVIKEDRKLILVHGKQDMKHRPVIVGAGPAGLFCAWLLAKEGYRPILLERGAPVEERREDVEKFWKTGVLNPSSNVQFGEGGAGTFSDGKLNTLVKDPEGLGRAVMELFVEHGAPEEILYEQKPHIGTDILFTVIQNLRRSLLAMGAAIQFHSQVTDIQIADSENGSCVQMIEVNRDRQIPTDILVLAIGHSARDTFEMLYQRELDMQAKAFAVGVRIEHPQAMIDRSQYGREKRGSLPAAAYKLTENLKNGRGVYTFCMCPGGYVVNASSEEGRLAVNGMSYHSRAGENANSAVIVTVTPDDFKEDHPLAGIAFQRELEERAFAAGEGCIPVQTFADFCENKASETTGSVKPNVKGKWKPANVRAIFPNELGNSLELGIKGMDRKIRGFASKDALLSGVESRTSSPVRSYRNEDHVSNVSGVYPCGEGAGYAGGITSAAMDGLRVARSIIQEYREHKDFTKN